MDLCQQRTKVPHLFRFVKHDQMYETKLLMQFTVLKNTDLELVACRSDVGDAGNDPELLIFAEFRQ